MKIGFQAKLSLWVCSILAVFFILISVAVGFKWFQRMSENLDINGLASAQETAYRLDSIFLQAKMSAELVARSLEQTQIEKSEIPNLLSEIVKTLNAECRDLVGLAVAYEEGMLSADERFNGYVGFMRDETFRLVHWNDGAFDYFRQDWYRNPLQNGRSMWTLPFKAEAISGEILSSYAVPFYRAIHGERHPAGVVVADITVGTLEQYLKGIKLPGRSTMSSQSKTFLMNENGLIVVALDNDPLLNRSIFDLAANIPPDSGDMEKIKDIFKTHTGVHSFQHLPVLPVGCELFHARCVNDWVVAVAVPSNWRVQIMRPAIMTSVTVGLLILVVIVLVIFWVCKRLSRPLTTLSHVAEVIGQGDFSALLPAIAGNDEIAQLTQSFGRMQSALTDYVQRLKESITARERTEGELNAAKAIQKDILPHVLPPFDNYPNVVGAADLIPARVIGGDLYDVFPIDAEHLALITGDVSGKGIPAALFMAVTQTLQRSIAQHGQQTDEIVARLNQMLSEHNDSNMFVTYWIGLLNVNTGVLTYTNAGHNPPYLKRVNGILEPLKARHGPPLGIVPGKTFSRSETQLHDGDILICYTDGVTEAFNATSEMFGEKRLEEILSRSGKQTPKEMLDAIETAVFAFSAGAEQSDDITLLLMRLQRDILERKRIRVPATDASYAVVIDFVESLPEFKQLDPKNQNRLMVAMEEIYVNIVRYAFDNRSGEVEVEAWMQDQQLRFCFVDAGIPYNPLAHEDPDITLPAEERRIGGLGILLVKKSMDYVNYQYVGGKNRFTIGKNLV